MIIDHCGPRSGHSFDRMSNASMSAILVGKYDLDSLGSICIHSDRFVFIRIDLYSFGSICIHFGSICIHFGSICIHSDRFVFISDRFVFNRIDLNSFRIDLYSIGSI